jgi:uncharacterized protein YndB with AHSA1/START domain
MRSTMPKAAQKSKSRDLTITRIFNAPVELVWKSWTDPELAKRWWGPKDFTAPVIRIDLRVGGKYLYDMRSPDGQDFWSTGVYREIIQFKKMVITDNFADEMGTIVPASHYGMTGEWPNELLVTLTFEDQKGKTKFTLLHEGLPPGEMANSAKDGWNESFDKLEKVLEEEKSRWGKNIIFTGQGKQEALIIRIIDAPRERVFEAFSDPNLIPQWWGPARLTTTVDKMDPRPGGTWRFLQRDTDGNEYAFHGVYHEFSPTRIVQTFEFEGMPGHVQFDIAMLEDLGGRTKLTEKSITESVEDGDAMLKAGMVDGWSETIDRLARLVEKK